MRDLDHVGPLFSERELGSDGVWPGVRERGDVGRCQNAKRAMESINKFGQPEMEAFFEVIYANYELLRPKSDSSSSTTTTTAAQERAFSKQFSELPAEIKNASHQTRKTAGR